MLYSLLLEAISPISGYTFKAEHYM